MYADNATAQFENVNSMRTYPFAEGSSLVDKAGVELPKDVIVDARFVVPFGMDGSSGFSREPLATVRMTSLHLSKSMVSVCFVAASGSSSVALSATVAAPNLAPYQPVMLEELTGSENAGGIVTFGDMELPSSPETHFFENAVVYPGCVAPARPVGVRSFFDPRSGESVSGDAEITFSKYVNVAKNGNEFRLTLEDGASEELASECANVGGYEACGATPITSINGIRPDSDGNIVLWFH